MRAGRIIAVTAALAAAWTLVNRPRAERIGPPSTWLHGDERAVPVPLWREVRALREWVALRRDPVRSGAGVPHGDGSAVIAVPGFNLGDWYLAGFRRWLARLGYRALPSRIGRNADCLDVVTDRLLATVSEAARSSGRPVHLVGHSLGGVLARSAAGSRRLRRHAGLAVPGPRPHPLVLRTWQAVRRRIHGVRGGSVPPACFSFACSCAAVEGLRAPLAAGVRQTAIHTRTDGVVDWRYCLTGDPAVDVEVPGSHVGLAVNPDAYRVIAGALAAAGERRAAAAGGAA
jgi:triacylglycerol lipase